MVVLDVTEPAFFEFSLGAAASSSSESSSQPTSSSAEAAIES